MNQHFLPVFYLKHFTDESTPAGYAPYVWLFQDLEWKRKAPNKIASARNFYAYKDENGSVSHFFEGKLQELENLMAPALCAISERLPESITGAERVCLSYLLVSMQQRTPGFLNDWGDELERLTKWQYRMLFISFNSDPERFEQFKPQFIGEDGQQRFANISMKDVTPDKFEHWSVRPVKAYTLSQVMKTWELLSGIIYSMNWVMLYADTPVFVTSEAPVVSIMPLENGSWRYCPFTVPIVDVSIPLTSKRALLCSWRGEESYKLVKASDKDIRTLNLRTINSGSDTNRKEDSPIEIIAPCRNFPFSEIVDEVSTIRRQARAADGQS